MKKPTYLTGATLSEQVANTIIHYINEQNLEANDKLPNELELAKMLGVSRTTIREAIKILVSKSIVYIKRGAGTYVSDEKYIENDPLGLKSISSDKFKIVFDLLEIRFMLEPNLAFSAALNASEKEIQNLEKQCKKIETLILSNESHIQEDILLHKMIAKASKNEVVENLIPIINSSIYALCDVTNRALKDETISMHKEIVENIKNRDASGAKYAMEMHLYYNRRAIIELSKQK